MNWNIARYIMDKMSRHIAFRLKDEIALSVAEIKEDQNVAEKHLADISVVLDNITSNSNIVEESLNELKLQLESVATSVERVYREVETLLSRVERIRRETEFSRHHRSAYLGDGVSVVWLPDDTIMYVNSNDEGGPSALISGGRYEEEYFSVFQSFLSPTSLVLDIGANLGIYALRSAQGFRNSTGKIIAFEPHPLAFELFQRSIMHNGLQNQIDARRVALSDQTGELTLFYPERHIGGGGYLNERDNSIAVRAKLEILDALLLTQQIDLVKIDVEGNELSVLRGMRAALARSPRVAILFEKLQDHAAEDQEQYGLLSGLGLSVYAVDSGSRLRLLDFAGYEAFSGYALAARSEVVGDDLDRRFFNIGWRQLSFPDGADVSWSTLERSASAQPEGILFHGPYWYLPKGRYRISITGSLDQPVAISITEQFGVEVVRLMVGPETMMGEFETPYDLRKFECVARADLEAAQISIQLVRIQRI